jgi:hypothetical protein
VDEGKEQGKDASWLEWLKASSVAYALLRHGIAAAGFIGHHIARLLD